MKTEIPAGIAVINGHFSLISEAKIPLTDRGFLFGHAVFETILVLNGNIISWEKHFERLMHSCQKTYIEQPNETDLKNLAFEAIKKNIELSNSVSPKMTLRIIISGGNSLNLPIEKRDEKFPSANQIILCRNTKALNEKILNEGINLKTRLDIRPKDLLEVKSCNYLFSIIALEEAKEEQFDDVIFYNSKNLLTECTSANFIWFDKNYNLYSHPFEKNCLPGTTLMLLIEGLAKNGVLFHWKGLPKNKLSSAVGCAILSSTRLIVPVQKIDQTQFDIEKQKSFFTQLNLILEKKMQ